MTLNVIGPSDPWSMDGTALGLIEDTAENRQLLIECCCLVASCECPCQYVQDKWDNIELLNAHFDYPAGCGLDEDIQLLHSGAPPGIIPAEVGDCPQWGATYTTSAFGTLLIAVWCTDTTLNMVIVQATLGASPCVIGEEGVPIAPTSLTCDANSLEGIFDLPITDNPDPNVLIDCPCPGENLVITVS